MRNKGMFIFDISRAVDKSEKTIRKVLNTDEHKSYCRTAKGSKLDPYKQHILKRMDEGCSNGIIIYDEIKAQGYTGKQTILRDFMRPHRKRCKQKAYKRFETNPGEQAQVDWGEFTLDYDSSTKRIHAFVMLMGYSRTLTLNSLKMKSFKLLLNAMSVHLSILEVYQRLLYMTI